MLGAGGQLGSDLARLVPGAVAMTREQLSVTDAAGVRAALERHRPEVVFNCAAYNPVDRAETEPERALSVNSDGAFNAAAACRTLGMLLVHYSTNFVFDGRLDRPYLESDPVGPLGAYARSKAEGERRVLAEHPAALVIRTAALFGSTGSRAKGGSFPDRIVRAAREGKPLTVVADQKVNPTYTPDLAEAVGQHKRLCGRCPEAPQRLPGVRARAAAEALGRGAEGLGGEEPSGCIKKLGPGDFSTPAPSLAAGGEVLIQ